MNQRELDIMSAEAQAEVDEMWQEFMTEWLGQRAPVDVDIAQENNGSTMEQG